MGFLTGKSTWDGGDVANQNQQKAVDMRDSNLAANRVNQVGPDGSSTWSIDPTTKQATQTTTLNPQQQTLYDNKAQVGANLGQASVNLSQNMIPTLSQGLDFNNGLQAWQGVNAGGANPTAYDWLGNSGGTGAGAASSVAGIPVGNSSGGYSSGGGGGGGGGSYSVSAASSTPANAGNIRTTFDTSNVTAKLPSTIDDTSRQRVEEALMSRLNPQLENDTNALRSRLLNSGIEVGTDAYNREMTLNNQKGTDARMQAVLAGGQEEDRQTKLLQGLNDQQFQQALATGKFGQDAETAMAQNATSMSNAQTAAGATLGAANINNQGASSRLAQQLEQQSREFNVNTGFKAAAFNNDLRNQQMQEQITARQEPLKELQAMQNLSNPSMPTFQSYYTNSANPATQGPPQTINSGNDLFDAVGGANKMWNMGW
jgi:hypothetical protein